MNFYEILAPTHESGKYVLVFLVGLVGLWAAVLLSAIRTARGERRFLRSLDGRVTGSIHDVKWLQPRASGSSVALALSHLSGLTRIEAEAASARVMAAVEKHLSARLPFLQTLLNLFVVIGLLGTLFGLAESLPRIQAQDRDLTPLLSGLRSAFAPSIWGIAASIVCGIVLAGYRLILLDPLLADLRKSIAGWIEGLAKRTQVQVESAAQATLEAAQDVVRFASEIRDDSAQLKTVVEETVGAFVLLQNATKKIEGSLRQGAAAVADAAGQLSAATAGVSEAVGQLQRTVSDTEQRRVEVEAMVERAVGVAGRMEESIEAWTKASGEHLGRVERILSEQTRSLGTVAPSVADAAEALKGSATTVADRAASLVKEELAGRATALDTTLSQLDKHVTSLRTPFENAADRLVNVGNLLVPAANRVEVQASRLAEAADRKTTRSTHGDVDMSGIESLLQDLILEVKRNPIRRFLRFR